MGIRRVRTGTAQPFPSNVIGGSAGRCRVGVESLPSVADLHGFVRYRGVSFRNHSAKFSRIAENARFEHPPCLRRGHSLRLHRDVLVFPLELVVQYQPEVLQTFSSLILSKLTVL